MKLFYLLTLLAEKADWNTSGRHSIEECINSGGCRLTTTTIASFGHSRGRNLFFTGTTAASRIHGWGIHQK